MTGAELTVKIIKEQGIQHIFGYPGGAILPIYDALYNSGVTHYLCRHEQGAGFAAVGYARASGNTGVVMATSGPGATNLITALADAKQDSVPVVAITGQVARTAMGSDAFQEIDTLGLSLTVTKHSYQVMTPEELPHLLREAFIVAKEGRPGPVLIDIPKDIQQAFVDFMPHLSIASEPCSADPQEIDKAYTLIQQAQKPVAYVGGGVHMAKAEQHLNVFLQEGNIPATTTLKGIGTIDPAYPYFLGMLGMHGTPAANNAIQQSDLLICIGARFDDRVTGKLNEFAPQAKVIHLDIDPAEISKNRKADVALIGDLNTSLPAITVKRPVSDWSIKWQQEKMACEPDYSHPGERIYAPLLLKQLSERLPENTVVSCDVGQHQMWVAQHMTFNHPSNHLSSGGLGTMGFGLPSGIGAHFSRPHDTTVVISGDGSFMMNVQELASIKRFQIPIKIIVLDNSRLGMVRQWQQLFYDQRYSETDLSDNPDFVALAAAFDIPGMCILCKNQVLPALDLMLAQPGAFLLHVKINEMDNVWPLVPPGAANHIMMTGENNE